MNSVRLGIIGCGGFMRHRLSNFDTIQEAQIVALCDPDPVQVDKTVEKYPHLGAVPRFANHQDLIKAGGMDAVLIATPHSQHASQIVESLSAGLHVLCEKPLVASVEQARRVMAVQLDSGKTGMVAYQRHFQAEFRYIRDQIATGNVGSVQFASALLAQEWKVFTNGSWRQDPVQSCGGMLNDSGSHMMDALLWMTGLSASSVAAHQANRETPVEINSSVSIVFSNGALGTISVIGDAQEWCEEITIWCDAGTFYVRDGTLSMIDKKGNKMKIEKLVGGSSVDRHFIDCVLGRCENEAPFECALRVVELTEAAAKSAASGGSVVKL